MFSKIVNPHYPRAAAGFRRESVTVVSLGRQSRNFALRRAATVDLAAGVLQPDFSAVNINAPEELLEAVREALASAGLQGQKRWSVSLPADSAKTSILTLEVAPKTKKELDDVLNWKAERTFGEKSADMRLAFQPLTSDGSRPRYFAVAVKNEVLAEYEELFSSLGWHVGLVLPRHLSEAQWLVLPRRARTTGDALLVSSQADGFTAFLLRGSQPAVVRSVMCEFDEREDELYRLLLFYRDRWGNENGGAAPHLDKFLIVGEGFAANKLHEISQETLGYDLHVLKPEDVGLMLPGNTIRFEDVAAPAALASLAYR